MLPPKLCGSCRGGPAAAARQRLRVCHLCKEPPPPPRQGRERRVAPAARATASPRKEGESLALLGQQWAADGFTQGAAGPEKGVGSPMGSGMAWACCLLLGGSQNWPQQHLCPGLSHHAWPEKLFARGPATHQQSSQQGLGNRQPGCGEEERLGELTSPRRALPLPPPKPPHRAEG